MSDLRVEQIGDGFAPARSEHVFTVEIDGEAVLLDEAAHRLHHLNAPAALVWACLDGRATVRDLAAELSEELRVPEPTVLADILTIVHDLGAEGLLEGVGAETEAVPDPAAEDEYAVVS